MKQIKIIIIGLVVILAIIGIYLNRSYAYIYSKFEGVPLPTIKNYMTQIKTEKSQLITYVAIGDSLTAGVGATSVSSSLPALLAEKISEASGILVAVKNLGVSGATSFDLLTGQVLDAGQYNPEIITVFIGTNDVHNFVPLEKFKNNLLTAITTLQQTTSAKIFLINIPYLGAKDLILPPYDLYFALKIEEYNQAINDVALSSGVELVDLYSGSVEAFKHDGTLYCSDRFHPGDSGYKLWANLIYESIK